jgi:uncharacterized protein (DUF1501 family)
MGKTKNISRREFIGQASCAGLGSMAMMNSVLNLGMINTVAARPHVIENPNDYKAMVCILLAGGADSFNMLVPTDTANYNEYAATRSTLALPNVGATNGLGANIGVLPINFTKNGRTWGVHPGMTRVRDLFNNEKLSFISNIGTLIEPVLTKQQYDSGLKKIPLGLYSHSDQIMQWQTSVPQNRNATGFAGRMADLLSDMNTVQKISMNISLAGTNRFQAGQETFEFTVSNNADISKIGFQGYPWWYGNGGILTDNKNKAILGMAEQSYQSVFQKTYATKTTNANESLQALKDGLGKLVPLTTTFSNTNLSRDMKKIAELIRVQNHLGANRQIFFVSFGGWDHHDNILQQQGTMLPILSNALYEFNNALNEIGKQNNVVTFTISDFARTLTSNGNGTDHAWGGNVMVMGEPITGGKIFGNYPSLGLNSNNLNLSNRGMLIPTTSVDEMYAELALWYGASPNDLNYILPNLCNFYSSNNCTSPVSTGYGPIGLFS